MMFSSRKRNRRKPERSGRSFSLAWPQPALADRERGIAEQGDPPLPTGEAVATAAGHPTPRATRRAPERSSPWPQSSSTQPSAASHI